MAAQRVYVFLLLRRGGKAERIVVWDTPDISLGRAPENDIVVEDPEMSRTQVSFRRDGEAFLVVHLSTANPSYINGETFTTHSLKNKDALKVGDTELFFYRVTQNPVTLDIKTEYASQLKGFGPAGDSGDGEATILGLVEEAGGGDDFDVRPASDFNYDMAGMEQFQVFNRKERVAGEQNPEYWSPDIKRHSIPRSIGSERSEGGASE